MTHHVKIVPALTEEWCHLPNGVRMHASMQNRPRLCRSEAAASSFPQATPSSRFLW